MGEKSSTVITNPYRNQILVVMALGLLGLLAFLSVFVVRWYLGPTLPFDAILQYPGVAGRLVNGLLAYDELKPALFVITQPRDRPVYPE